MATALLPTGFVPQGDASRTVMSLDGALVSDNHLRALLADGRARAKLEGHEIIQSAPTTYVVDEARGVVKASVKSAEISTGPRPSMLWRGMK